MDIILKENQTLSTTWEAKGTFSWKVEFFCGDCLRHNRKRKAFTNSDNFAFGSCDFCGKINFFKIRKNSIGGTVLLTLG